MANPTSNFGWQMPTNTDLVKDLPADFEVFGQAVDTSLMDLKGGTTGQVLSKASNTDMDFTWVTSDDANAIQNTIVDAKGDLISASANDVPARLAAGSNGDSLVVDSGTSTGLRWQGNYAAGKNRIINGAMLIDQRNSASSAITINTAASTYSVDRWLGFGQATDGVFTLAQDTSAPVGFTKSLKATVTTADASIAATQIYVVSQNIEGLQVADFDFGTANAKTVTLSFWVRSSLTGTFGGSIRNGAADRSYPFTYSISVADTWEKKSVTLVGDTTGTWLKDTGIGLRVTFSLGAGVDRVGTAGAWNGNNNAGATGQTQVISTLNATWYVSSVQLEIGSVGTAFTNAGGTFAGELAACQRYFVRYNPDSTPDSGGIGTFYSTTACRVFIPTPTTMRTAPSITVQNTTVDRIGTGNTTPTAWGASSRLTIHNVSYDITGCSPAATTYQQAMFNGFTDISAEL